VISVLVVEDDPMFGKVVGRDLAEHGFDVSLVETVADARAALSSRPIDVLLTDLRLGAEDGIDLLESLRATSPRTRALLMSGFATARDYQRAVELGAVRVLCKPFTPQELISCIRQAVECETGFRGSVHGLSLVDMLQMFNYGRRSVSITVAGSSEGRLHLRDGQIVHAEHAQLTGEAALRSLLGMPTGTVGTQALVAEVTPTITRDFREVLLDALRAVDEERSESDEVVTIEHDLEEAFAGLDEPSTEPAKPDATEHILARVRRIDGYVAACLVLADSGGVLRHDGELDLRPAAPIVAELVRRQRETFARLGDVHEETLVAASTQYHLLRELRSPVPAFVHLVLDRARANPAMAKHELESAVHEVAL